MSSSGNTASTNAYTREGWLRTNNSIRSVVSHPLALPLVLCLCFFDDVDATDQLNGDRFLNLQSDLSQLNYNDTTAKMAACRKHFMGYLHSLPETADVPSAEVQSVPSSRDRFLDMAWLVDDLKFTTTVETVLSTLSLDKLHADLKAVFKNFATGTGTGSKETALVADILKAFHKWSDGSLLFKSEGGVKCLDRIGEKPTNCRYNLLVAQQEPLVAQLERDSHTCRCTPILFIEFGLGNSIWWKKLDQAYSYVNLMTSPDNVGPIKEESLEIEYMPLFGKAMLMSAITIDKDTGAFRIAIFLCWRRQNEPMKAAKKIKVSEIPVDGFDMVLLWRSMWINGPTQNQVEDDESEDIKSMDMDSEDVDSENFDHPGSNEFAMALVAIFVAMQCLKDWQKKECSDNFSVLGPNCCKVKLVQTDSTPVVLRSYDTRLRPTSCSPHLYLKAKVKATYDEAQKKEPAQLSLGRPLLYLGRSTAAAENPNVRSIGDRNFGDTHDIATINEKIRENWLWDNYGKLQLIEAPYLESLEPNAHEAKRPGDFIPIINHLLHLHEQGFVHGDIQAFNMVFNGMGGKWIDFDLSGEVV